MTLLKMLNLSVKSKSSQMLYQKIFFYDFNINKRENNENTKTTFRENRRLGRKKIKRNLRYCSQLYKIVGKMFSQITFSTKIS